jgi:hypothetical protein
MSDRRCALPRDGLAVDDPACCWLVGHVRVFSCPATTCPCRTRTSSSWEALPPSTTSRSAPHGPEKACAGYPSILVPTFFDLGKPPQGLGRSMEGGSGLWAPGRRPCRKQKLAGPFDDACGRPPPGRLRRAQGVRPDAFGRAGPPLSASFAPDCVTGDDTVPQRLPITPRGPTHCRMFLVYVLTDDKAPWPLLTFHELPWRGFRTPPLTILPLGEFELRDDALACADDFGAADRRAPWSKRRQTNTTRSPRSPHPRDFSPPCQECGQGFGAKRCTIAHTRPLQPPRRLFPAEAPSSKLPALTHLVPRNYFLIPAAHAEHHRETRCTNSTAGSVTEFSKLR